MARKTVLILGAGELGEAIISSLTADQQIIKDHEIKVLLRPSTIKSEDPSKVTLREFLSTRGVSFVSGDLVEDSRDTLTSIF